MCLPWPVAMPMVIRHHIALRRGVAPAMLHRDIARNRNRTPSALVQPTAVALRGSIPLCLLAHLLILLLLPHLMAHLVLSPLPDRHASALHLG